MTPEIIFENSYNLLAQILEEAFAEYPDEGDLRVGFSYRHGKTILNLAEDVFSLEKEGRCHSSSIIVRSMLESLFNLVAAVKQPAFAAGKLCWEVEEEVKRIRKWLLPEDPSLADTVKLLTELAQSLRTAHQLPPSLNWNTLACADAAQLGEQYRREYYLFSKNVHMSMSGIVSREKAIGRGHRLKTLAYILLSTSGHLVQIVPTKTPQKHVDEASETIQQLTVLINAGAFKQFDSDAAD